MDQLVLFIQTNWQGIATIVIALATLLITIFKRKVKVVDTIKGFILDRLPVYIDTAEKILSIGSQKKDFVMASICQLVKETFGCDVDQYIDFISDSIESILATPQKKGD